MSEPVRIGVLDSGVSAAYQHIIVNGMCFVPGEHGIKQTDDIEDHVGHGTAVSRQIAETAPDAQMIHVRVFGTRFTSTPAIVAAGLDWLSGQHVDIVNMSFGMPEERAVLKSACERATKNGLLLVASAPAQGPAVYPAGWPGVISVTGDARCQDKGQISDLLGIQADFGAWCASPEQGGGDIAGSSIAAAHFTGLVANFLQQNSGGNRDSVMTAFRSHAICRGPEQRSAEVKSS